MSILNLLRKFKGGSLGDARNPLAGCTVSQALLQLGYKASLTSGGDFIGFRDAGFSAFSQHEEDGLLLYIFSLIGTSNRFSVEMCAGDGIECNTANLLLCHRWSGVLFDGDPQNVRRGTTFYRDHPVTRYWPPNFQCKWITRDNINELISDCGVQGEIDLFSLDVDGVDYWLWAALSIINPRVVILEFNHLWGPKESVTVPYHDDFKADFTQYGSDYAGASLAAFVKLGAEKGYYLAGTNAIATNAFFIRRDLLHRRLPEIAPESCFSHPRARFGMERRLPLVRHRPWERV